MRPTAVVILAAGKGVRMKSDLPKVCHILDGRPLIAHVLHHVREISPAQIIVVIGHGAELVKKACEDRPSDRPSLDYVIQSERLGTGHAVMQAVPALRPEIENVLVVSGDVPLLSSESLKNLLTVHQSPHPGGRPAVTVLTAVVDPPGSYGRIVRGPGGDVLKIVENRDASADEKTIREVNTGTYVFHRNALESALSQIRPLNAQSEYYLTDAVAILRSQNRPVAASILADAREMSGINTPEGLAAVGQLYAQLKRASAVPS